MPREDDEDLEQAEYEDDEEDSEEQAPEQTQATSESPSPKRRGRKPGSKNKPKESRAGGLSQIPQAPGEPNPDDPVSWTDDPLIVWPNVIAYCERKGYQPSEVISIAVCRKPAGPHVGDNQALQTIPGASVLGDSLTTPGDALMRYVIEVYHMAYDRPATYELRFLFRPNRSRALKTAHLTLADPREMLAVKSRAAQLAASTAYQGPALGSTYPLTQPPWVYPQASQVSMQSPPTQAAQPLGTLPQGAHPQSQHAPSYDPTVSQAVENLRRELGVVFGMMTAQQQHEAARQLGMGAPPAPSASPTWQPLAVAPPSTAPSTPASQAEMIAATVAATIQALGLGAAPRPSLVQQPPALPFNPYVVQHTPTQPQVGLGSMVSDLKERVGAFREIGKLAREFDGLKEQFGFGEREETAPAVEAQPQPADPNGLPFAVRKIPFTGSALSGGQDVNWVSRYKTDVYGNGLKDSDGNSVPKGIQEWAMEMAAANPALAANFMEQATRIVDNTSLGALLRRFAEQGAVQSATPAALSQSAGAAPAAAGLAAAPQQSNGIAAGMPNEPPMAPAYGSNGRFTPP